MARVPQTLTVTGFASRLSLAAALLLSLSCASTGSAPPPRSSNAVSDSQLCFRIKEYCPNWQPALEIARERAGCGKVNPHRKDRETACQSNATCDLCLFLNDDLSPDVVLKDIGRPAQSVEEEPRSALANSLRHHFRHITRIQRALCFGDNNVIQLASTMVHEADHLCHSITGEWNPDGMGRRNQETDECHAYGTERNCGFSPDTSIVSTGCF